MGMKNLPDMYARARGPQAQRLRAYVHIRQIMNAYVTGVICKCHSNNISKLNAASNCHICLWGYKPIHYSQGVEDLHSPTYYIIR